MTPSFTRPPSPAPQPCSAPPACAPLPQEYVRQLADDTPLIFVVGAFAHGKIDQAYCDQFISISQYPLSAAYALSRITNALELKWGIV